MKIKFDDFTTVTTLVKVREEEAQKTEQQREKQKKLYDKQIHNALKMESRIKRLDMDMSSCNSTISSALEEVEFLLSLVNNFVEEKENLESINDSITSIKTMLTSVQKIAINSQKKTTFDGRESGDYFGKLETGPVQPSGSVSNRNRGEPIIGSVRAATNATQSPDTNIPKEAPEEIGKRLGVSSTVRCILFKILQKKYILIYSHY